MTKNKINIAILLGDPSGIGPELISKLLSEDITNKANKQKILLNIIKKTPNNRNVDVINLFLISILI